MEILREFGKVLYLAGPSAHEAPCVALLIEGVQTQVAEPMGAKDIAPPLEVR